MKQKFNRFLKFYGMSGKTVKDIKIDKKDAEMAIEVFKSSYPELEKFIASNKQKEKKVKDE